MKCVATRLSRTLREAFSLGRVRNLSPVRTARYGVRRRYRAQVAESCGTDVPRAYVALSLRLKRLVPALVAPIAVDPAISRAVGNEPTPTAAELVRQAGRLAAALPDSGLAPHREGFLAGQVAALEWRARQLAGQHLPFRREVRECLGLRVAPGEPDAYRAAHRELAALLPGAGSTGERLATHRRRDVVPPDRLGLAVRALSAALRDRVAPWSGPAAAGDVEYRLVDGAPWSALQAYAGDRRSVVRVNAAAALGASRLPRMVAHEAYPGHHLECSRGEAAVRAGRVELGVSLLGSPQTVVSEGLAECGLGTAVGPGWGPWAAGVLADVGVSLDGRLAERLDPLLAVLRRVRVDAALLLHDGGAPTSERIAAAEEHLRCWLLLDTARARRVVGSLARPLWRAHVVASVEGTAIVDRWLEQGPDLVTRHLRLLDAPGVPNALRSRTCT